MKFSQLPSGQRFRYQGQTYTKTGPLSATGKDGGQRMIPRSAAVETDQPPPPRDTAPGRLSAQAVQQAFEQYHGLCLALLGDDERAEKLRHGRLEFLRALGLPTE